MTHSPSVQGENALNRDRRTAALYGALSLGLFMSLFTLMAPAALSQTRPEIPYYARTNSFGILLAYSGDSSHMLLGNAEKRKLLNIGISYSRKLLASRVVNWQYNGELYPVALESDPLSRFVNQQTEPTATSFTIDGPPPISCAPIVNTYNYRDPNGVNYAGTTALFCHGRQWTVGEGMSPIGMQWNFCRTEPCSLFSSGTEDTCIPPGRFLSPLPAHSISHLISGQELSGIDRPPDRFARNTVITTSRITIRPCLIPE